MWLIRAAAYISLFRLGLAFWCVPAAAQQADLVPVNYDKVLRSPVFDQEVWNRRAEIVRAVTHSLKYLGSPAAAQAYARFEGEPFSRTIVARSLLRFRELLMQSESLEGLHRGLRDEFHFYRARGQDGLGKVRFTGYFQPTYRASRKRTSLYRYPIYRRPSGLDTWAKPYPTRVALEGYAGTGNARGLLPGLELAWLTSRFEAFMIHVQGSAVLDMTDGSRMPVGFAGVTDYPFTGFVKNCLMGKPRQMSIERYFRANPDELNRCLSRNNRFVFFEERRSPDPIGSLGVPVLAKCSLATDKARMPPGALAIAQTYLPQTRQQGGVQMVRSNLFVLDQDSGGAIKGPGRADIFMGSGPEAGRLARAIYDNGELFYLVLKPEAL